MSRVADKCLSGVFYVLTALSLVKKSKSAGEKLRVTVHGATGQGSFGPGKFMTTIRLGEEKFRTGLKKATSLIWEESAEFQSPADADDKEIIVLKLRKAKKCTERTVGTVTINVKEALETNLHLPIKRRYLVTHSDKQQRCRVFLEVSVTVEDGKKPSKGETSECSSHKNCKAGTNSLSSGKTTEGEAAFATVLTESTDTVASPAEINPHCREQISSIASLYEELTAKQSSSADLLTYVDGLRAKLAVAAPHVLDNVVIKNMAANVPDFTHYELPDMAAESLEGLEKILNVVQRLNEEEDARLHFIQRWYVEELCRQAMEEAPEVLEGG
ncbi:uncharacterized protein LOC118410929 [Branchiostoma floridae]|uniref:Uncharacterized protein LOC118410929 n=1 Tax=Branchiostoma floridae TaxID=7739 RepID=C3ZH88_BRAFL|nr:uncharacterized protein LOC118410929 [Branchiostoma floridae]|eukprot:XP_002592060.1 hypothetical protein BRAFLDRAFT_104766 [Branchiostoma floridae]